MLLLYKNRHKESTGLPINIYESESDCPAAMLTYLTAGAGYLIVGPDLQQGHIDLFFPIPAQGKASILTLMLLVAILAITK